MGGNTWAKRPSTATLICPRSPRGKGNKQKLARSIPRMQRAAGRRGRRLRVVRPDARQWPLLQQTRRADQRAPSRRDGREGEGGREPMLHPMVNERLEQLGATRVGSTPQELAAFLKSEMDKWGPVIRE